VHFQLDDLHDLVAVALDLQAFLEPLEQTEPELHVLLREFAVQRKGGLDVAVHIVEQQLQAFPVSQKSTRSS
jgi:hypothetical protein